jgi:hypothetical protein
MPTAAGKWRVESFESREQRAERQMFNELGLFRLCQASGG